MFSTVPVGSSALGCYFIQFYLLILLSGAVGLSPAALNRSFQAIKEQKDRFNTNNPAWTMFVFARIQVFLVVAL